MTARRWLPLLLIAGCSQGPPPPAAPDPLNPMKSPTRPSESRPTNRLAREKSPYLLQHAHNPVDWYPWGDEAFAKARSDDKPVFLSIGYSTCHWCHVMERESFENEEVARVLNERFVSIKVDREERPDIDQVYMAAVQAMGQHGGWPLSVFLTPERQPFFGGTYFPPEDRFGRIGFKTLLLRLSEAWKTRREELVAGSRELSDRLASASASPAERGSLTPAVLEAAVRQFASQYDPEWGGFGPAPKFPRSVALEFLLREHARTGDVDALRRVERTLLKMSQGGMYDQLGGGFARYSTDEEWLVPHFEKMLYDNALLVRAYVQAWQITKNPLYERIVRETIAYVLRDLRSPEGAFFSAEDADSEGIEGKFYVWNPAQIREVLGERDARIVCEAFGVTPEGNWEPHEEGIPRGNSCLRIVEEAVKFHKRHGLTEEEWRRLVESGRRRLFEARTKRVRPHRDDKVLTDWNALMIGALAQAGAAFGDPSYVRAAEDAAAFLRARMRRDDGRLLHRYRDGEAAIPGYLDDYAFLADAMVDLYQATFKVEYLEDGLRLADETIRLFADPQGGFWFTASDNEALIARMKGLYDGALPSGTAVACHALLRLGTLSSRDDLRKAAERAFEASASQVSRHPSGYPHLLSAYSLFRGPSREVVIAGDSPEMLRVVRSAYLPDGVIAWAPAAGPDARALKAIPMLEGKKAIEGRPAAYVCENYACKAPVTSVQDLGSLLKPRR